MLHLLQHFLKRISTHLEVPIEPIWYLLLKYKVFIKAVLNSSTTIGVQETKNHEKWLPESSNPDSYWTCNLLNRPQMGSIENNPYIQNE